MPAQNSRLGRYCYYSVKFPLNGLISFSYAKTKVSTTGCLSESDLENITAILRPAYNNAWWMGRGARWACAATMLAAVPGHAKIQPCQVSGVPRIGSAKTRQCQGPAVK